MQDFHHAALVSREYLWDLKNVTWLRGKYVDALSKNMERKNLVSEIIDAFEAKLTPVLSELPMQTIHGDLNELNILVEDNGFGKEITGLIDFGDMNYSCRVFDLAICMAYMALLRHQDPTNTIGIVLAGYLSKCDLTDKEIDVLYLCVLGRLVQSLVIGNYQSTVLDPGNEYLVETAKHGWTVLRKLWCLTETEVQKMLTTNS